MWTYTLDHYLDLAAFCLLAVLATLLVDRWLRRAAKGAGVGRRAWVLLVILLAGGSFLAYLAGENERAQLRQTLEGFAPTYALELGRMGHSKIGLDTKPDDPAYLELIQAEIRWEKVNLAVNDIYT